MKVTANNAAGYQQIAAATEQQAQSAKKADTEQVAAPKTGAVQQDTVTISAEAKALLSNDGGAAKALGDVPPPWPKERTSQSSSDEGQLVGDVPPPWPPAN